MSSSKGAAMATMELVPDIVSHDTVEALEHLLKRAKAGELTGIAFAAILKRRRYIVNTAGAAFQYPTFSRGMLRALDDELARRVNANK